VLISIINHVTSVAWSLREIFYCNMLSNMAPNGPIVHPQMILDDHPVDGGSKHL
jgi:hypothetical protein